MDESLKNAKKIARWNGRMVGAAGVIGAFLLTFNDSDVAFLPRLLLAATLLAISLGSAIWMVQWGSKP